MEQPLAGKSVAILVANGFDEVEMTEVQRALLKAGAVVRTISPESGLVNGWHGAGWGHYFPVDKLIGEALGADFDNLLLPGGVRSIAKLQKSAHTRRIVGHFLDGGKPIAAIADGVALMAIPGKLRGRKVSAKADMTESLTAAGGRAADEDLVIDTKTVSARKIDDMEAFVSEVIKLFTGEQAVAQAA